MRSGFSKIFVLDTRILYAALPLHSYVQCPFFGFNMTAAWNAVGDDVKLSPRTAEVEVKYTCKQCGGAEREAEYE